MAQEQVQYEPGKLFVGGLSWDTTDVSMRAYFEKYGAVADCVVMKDPNQPEGLKRNRGFGFVKFENPTSVDAVFQHGNHFIDNKQVDPKKAVLKGGVMGGGIGGDHEKKIFTGGLASTTTEEDVREYFTSYLQKKGHSGTVMDIDFKMDRATNRMRGFGFVGFDSVETRDRVLEMSHHQIGGKMVEVKAAQPRGALASSTNVVMPQPHTPYGAHTQYQAPYQQAGGTSNGQYSYYHGTGGQPFYNPYPTQQQPGYGAQYNSAAGYPYDHSSYPRTQTSTDRQDTQSYYHHQTGYGHAGGQQISGGYQDSTSYQGRSGYPGTQDAGYSHQMAGYGRGAGQQQQQQQQPPPQPQTQARYGGGAGIGSYAH